MLGCKYLIFSENFCLVCFQLFGNGNYLITIDKLVLRSFSEQTDFKSKIQFSNGPVGIANQQS